MKSEERRPLKAVSEETMGHAYQGLSLLSDDGLGPAPNAFSSRCSDSDSGPHIASLCAVSSWVVSVSCATRLRFSGAEYELHDRFYLDTHNYNDIVVCGRYSTDTPRLLSSYSSHRHIVTEN